MLSTINLDKVFIDRYTGLQADILQQMEREQMESTNINKFKKQWQIQLMVILGVIWMLIFCYIPLFWLIIAFRDYNIAKPLFDSDFVGFKHFIDFLNDARFYRSVKNTLGISSLKLMFGFPIPILFALFLNEIKRIKFKRTVQTITYLPHFISWTIFGGILLNWLNNSGVINQLMIFLKLQTEPILYNADPKYFWSISVVSEIIKEMGWNAIIYIAAISSIDPQLYEASDIDGAGRYTKMWHITIPGIRYTIAILFILAVSNVLGSSFDQIFVLKNDINLKASETIDLFIHNMGIVSGRYSFSTAVLFCRSIVSLGLILIANQVSKKLTGDSIL